MYLALHVLHVKKIKIRRINYNCPWLLDGENSLIPKERKRFFKLRHSDDSKDIHNFFAGFSSSMWTSSRHGSTSWQRLPNPSSVCHGNEPSCFFSLYF